jgi:hypothetical protein
VSEALCPAELAFRVRARGMRLDATRALEFLEEWRERGIVEEHLGRWRLTRSGFAMFGGWADGIGLDDEAAA